MSDHHGAPDPIDKAYAQAEAMMDDLAARAARRDRVLAAVAEASTQAAAAKPRRSAWRRGWALAAAGLAGVTVLLATRVDRLEPAPRLQAPATQPSAAVTPLAPADASPPRAAAQPPERVARAQPEARAPALAAEPAPPPGLATYAPVAPPAQVEPAPPATPPPPPPPPPSPSLKASPPVPAAARSAAPLSGGSEIEEMVVTRSHAARGSAAAPDRLAARLRDAAARGRTSEVAALLARGAPIDDAGADGETALIKSILARHAATAALLVRRGADPDRTDDTGRSARDRAAALGDPDLDRALAEAR